MPEIVIRGRVHLPPIDWTGVPARFVGRASAVCRSMQDCEDLVKWFGDPTFCPELPVLVNAAGGWTAIAGMGYAPAAELKDCAVALFGRQAEKVAKLGTLFDFDEMRERAGLMRREDVRAAMSDALTRRIEAHKASPVTDPFRQPKYPRPNNRTLHTVAKVEPDV